MQRQRDVLPMTQVSSTLLSALAELFREARADPSLQPDALARHASDLMLLDLSTRREIAVLQPITRKTVAVTICPRCRKFLAVCECKERGL